MTDAIPDDIARSYAARGQIAVAGYDRDQALAIVREQRRRHAHRKDHTALANFAAKIRARLQTDLPGLDEQAVADALLAVSSMLNALAAEGVNAPNVLNIIAYLADDMATEAGW